MNYQNKKKNQNSNSYISLVAANPEIFLNVIMVKMVCCETKR